MKLVAIIGTPSSPLIYFANKIHKEYGISLLIIVEQNAKKKTAPSVNKVFGIERVLESVLFRISQTRLKKEREKHSIEFNYQCDRWYDVSYSEIAKGIPVHTTSNVNSSEVANLLKQINPEVMVVHGSPLINNNILSHAKTALNLHWGLSPYYRGVNCTSHAIINWDINNIGVTVHRLSSFIDGGEIYGQKRATINNLTDLKFVTVQLTQMGTTIMLDALSKIKNSTPLTFHQQQLSDGYLFKGIHWNQTTFSFVAKLDEHTFKLIKNNPSRPKLSIIEG